MRSRQVIHQVYPYDAKGKKPLNNPQIHNARKSVFICSLFSFRQENGLPVKKRISVELCDHKHSFRCSLNFSFIRYRLSYGETVAELTYRCKCAKFLHHNLPVYAFRQSELMTLEVMVCVYCLRR